jgi:hypothetical protein
MLSDAFIAIFICAFFGVVTFGHVLVITAIWPDLFRGRRQRHLDAIARGTVRLPQLK